MLSCLDMPWWFGCSTPCLGERLLARGFLECHATCELIGCVSTQGDNSFVVMTNFIVTPGQKQGTCPEVNALASFSSLSFCDLRGVCVVVALGKFS